MSFLVDLFSSSGLGAAIGSIAGIGQKIIATKMENEHKVKEWEHEYKLLQLQQDHDTNMQKMELIKTDVAASAGVHEAGYVHDASGDPSQWVDNWRAMVRPSMCWILAALTAIEAIVIHYTQSTTPATFAPFFGLVLAWYFSSRIRVEKYL